MICDHLRVARALVNQGLNSVRRKIYLVRNVVAGKRRAFDHSHVDRQHRFVGTPCVFVGDAAAQGTILRDVLGLG